MAMPQPSKLLAEWALTAPWAPSLEGWWTDLRVAGRALRRNPTFSLVTVLTLALGVGANAAIFTVVNAVLLRPLPYPAASRLVRLWETRPPTADWPDARPQRSQRITVAEILTLRPVLTTLTHLSFTTGPSLMTLTGAGQATRMQGMGVSPGYFETLGVSAHLGRTSGPAEEAPGADAVLILSDGDVAHILQRTAGHHRPDRDHGRDPGAEPSGDHAPVPGHRRDARRASTLPIVKCSSGFR